MKRFFLLAPLLATVLVLSGCSTPDDPSVGEQDGPPAELPEVPPVDETANVAALEKSATELKKNGRGNVIEVSFRGTSIGDAELDPLIGLPELRSVLLNDTAITDDGLKLLGQLAAIQNLDLRGCAIGNDGLAHLVGLGEFGTLRALRLSGQNNMTTVDDDGMVHVAELTSLEVLAVDFLWVSEAGLAKLDKLSRLEELYMAQTTIGDDAMGLLRQFPILKKLRISRNQISDTGLEMLGKNASLEELDLSENSLVSDEGFQHLAGMVSLKKLNLWRVSITDAGLVHLAGMVKMEWLNLDNSPVTNDGLVHLAAMKKLEFLHLGSTQVTDEGLDHLAGLTSLHDLKVTRTAVTEEGTMRLKKQLPHVTIQLKYIE
jgi:hypothetical protein